MPDSLFDTLIQRARQLLTPPKDTLPGVNPIISGQSVPLAEGPVRRGKQDASYDLLAQIAPLLHFADRRSPIPPDTSKDYSIDMDNGLDDSSPSKYHKFDPYLWQFTHPEQDTLARTPARPKHLSTIDGKPVDPSLAWRTQARFNIPNGDTPSDRGLGNVTFSMPAGSPMMGGPEPYGSIFDKYDFGSSEGLKSPIYSMLGALADKILGQPYYVYERFDHEGPDGTSRYYGTKKELAK